MFRVWNSLLALIFLKTYQGGSCRKICQKKSTNCGKFSYMNMSIFYFVFMNLLVMKKLCEYLVIWFTAWLEKRRKWFFSYDRANVNSWSYANLIKEKHMLLGVLKLNEKKRKNCLSNTWKNRIFIFFSWGTIYYYFRGKIKKV